MFSIARAHSTDCLLAAYRRHEKSTVSVVYGPDTSRLGPRSIIARIQLTASDAVPPFILSVSLIGIQVLISTLLLVAFVHADTVRLTSGDTVNGAVLDLTRTSIQIEAQGKLVVLPRASVASVELSRESAAATRHSPITLPKGTTLRLTVLGWAQPADKATAARVRVSLQTAAEVNLSQATIPVGSLVTGTLRQPRDGENRSTWTLIVDAIHAPDRQYALAPAELATPKVIRKAELPSKTASVTFEADTEGLNEDGNRSIAGADWLRKGNIIEAAVRTR